MNRSNGMLKGGGIRLSPIEVQSRICGQAAVLECAVVGVPDAERLIKLRGLCGFLNAGIRPKSSLAGECLLPHVTRRSEKNLRAQSYRQDGFILFLCRRRPLDFRISRDGAFPDVPNDAGNSLFPWSGKIRPHPFACVYVPSSL